MTTATVTVLGTGWVPDPPLGLAARAAAVARTARAAAGAGSLPERWTIPRAPWIMQQGASQACTGHVAAQGVYGLTGERCSPWFPWWWGRAHDLGLSDALPNVGVSMASVRRAMRDHGTCRADLWAPSDPTFAWGARPSAVARLDAQRRNLDAVPILAGAGAVASVRDALVRGWPVGVVVEVDPRFQRPADGLVLPAEGESRGLHIVTAWGYERGAEGWRVMIVNSWGPLWGDGGIAWLCEDRIRRARALVAMRGVS